MPEIKHSDQYQRRIYDGKESNFKINNYPRFAMTRRNQRRSTTRLTSWHYRIFVISLMMSGTTHQSSFFVRALSSSKFISNKGAEHVVEKQLQYLQDKNQVWKAYECFDDEAKADLGGWEAFYAELNKDPDLTPLFQHKKATVLMVLSQPDPTLCRCLVRLAMPHGAPKHVTNEYHKIREDDDDDDAETYHDIPLLYWWGMRFQQKSETAASSSSERPSQQQDEWKVQGIQAFIDLSPEGVDGFIDMEGDTVFIDEDGNILSEEEIAEASVIYMDEDGNEIDLDEWLELNLEEEEEDDDDDSDYERY